MYVVLETLSDCQEMLADIQAVVSRYVESTKDEDIVRHLETLEEQLSKAEITLEQVVG